MNWEMIGAIGEVGGAIAVVVTLVYLARQIRASAQASRQAAMQELLDQSLQFNTQLTMDAEVASLWDRGLQDAESLDRTELVRLYSLFYQMTLQLQRLYYLGQTGGLEPWLEKQTTRSRRDILAAPGYQSWFERRKHTLDDEFRAVVEAEMTEASRFAVYPEQKELPA